MKNLGRLLIIDDNEDVLFALNLLLEPYAEKIKITTSPENIEYFINSFNPDIILLDMNFSKDAISGQEGYYWLERILKIDPDAIVILMTAYSDTDKAVKAIKSGAIDFISKPWEKERLLSTLSSAMKLRNSRTEINSLKKQVAAMALEKERNYEIIGESEAMLQIFDTIEKLSNTDANILILGENGTGKDLVARAIYRNSPRAHAGFIEIDVGSIPESLFESELFGYEKGAFTDARKEKAGRMEIASGGTLFLDEIGNISMTMQAKLLTAIEKRKISKLGSTKTIDIDVRLICATNTDLHKLVSKGEFRQDLLYRINTIEIHIPPLRERGGDILLLADFFLKRYAQKYKKDIKGLLKDAQKKLLQYSWPGNVRELQHTIERAVILSDSSFIRAENFLLQPVITKKKNEHETLNLEEIEKEVIEKAMRRCNGNISQAAELLGISRYSLYRKIEKNIQF
ncbi:MAG TPA: sigma-54-dependent Fis family transcriptional regulator [Candidatus Gallibacteroides avistercoris]|uniref:Sigma-54-dependent Fis family transcriptional regulator n=1 Tax=Candidatus Gallibacteroides avistercoris TaxID=2840833 RepID=A0A9D1M9E3_9BACT|nr:sigma-54-dependent Fis family transcriptional regulator [Candidatus Gallibacteroides avistercoris]